MADRLITLSAVIMLLIAILYCYALARSTGVTEVTTLLLVALSAGWCCGLAYALFLEE